MTHKKTATTVTAPISMVSSYDHGRYYIHTVHSVYRLDLEAETLTRFPAAPDASYLRGDCDPQKLVRVVECAVGEPGLFILSGLAGNGAQTIRSTTCVQRIELVA